MGTPCHGDNAPGALRKYFALPALFTYSIIRPENCIAFFY